MDEYMLFLGIWLLSLLLTVIPQNGKPSFAFLLSIGIAAISSFWAIETLITNSSFILKGIGTSEIIIDPLSAIFILILNFTVLTGGLFGIGYLKGYSNKPNWQISLHWIAYISLQVAMISVVILPGGLAFLAAWELMAVSSFLLVIFESDKLPTLKTGIMYLVQMHIAFFLLLTAFLWLDSQTGTMLFEGIKEFQNGNQQVWLFVVFALGFGIKAGFIPLHTWLPHAHPAAPSHVSGVMSGVMIKTGIYGIMRVILQVDPQNLFGLGVGMVVISVITGLLGVILAIVQHDLKKLLAYHSIENIGIIGLGLGLGMIGTARNMPLLAILGYSGAIIHVWNHSLFKSLLFYGAGSVYSLSHVRNIEKLGGLIKAMPQTAGLFLIGALAICGLPPFNGFISEYLIYKGMFTGFGNHGLELNLLLLSAIIGLVLIGGLALFCFTKAFGLVFLGSPRSEASKSVRQEANLLMRLPQYIIVGVILSIGLFPEFYWGIAQQAIGQFHPASYPNPLDFTVVAVVGRTSAILLAIIALLWLVRRWQQSRVSVTKGPAWGCAYTGGNPAVHQYTATSFSRNITDLLEPVVNVQNDYLPLEEEEIFPAPRTFHTHQSDPIESKAILPVVNGFLRALRKLAILQTGKIRHYLIYPLIFLGLIVLLTLLQWI